MLRSPRMRMQTVLRTCVCALAAQAASVHAAAPVRHSIPGASNIVLSGVLAGRNASPASLALLEIDGKTVRVKIGDMLPGGDVIRAILQDRVIFGARDSYWTLLVADRSALRKRVEPVAASLPSVAAPSVTTRQEAGAHRPAVLHRIAPLVAAPPIIVDDIWAIPSWLQAGQAPPAPVFDPAVLKSPWGKK